MFVQLTLLTFYCRLATYRTFHYLCYLLMFLSAFMSVFRVIFSSIWCFRIHSDGLICKENQILMTVHAAVGISTNCLIFIMPIPMLWRLKNVSVPRRLGLIAIFSVGLIAVGACLSKAFVIKSVMKERDPTWGMPWIAIICEVELGAGLSCACLPMLRPLFLSTSWFSSTPKGPPPVDDIPKAEWRGDSGNGTALLRRAKAGWDGKSLTATWQGVQRYYHIRWGRKRSIIEVADLEGLGVLGSHWDYPNLPGESGKTGYIVSNSSETQVSGDIEYRGNQTPGEEKPLPSPTPPPRSHQLGISPGESRCLPRSKSTTTSQ